MKNTTLFIAFALAIGSAIPVAAQTKTAPGAAAPYAAATAGETSLDVPSAAQPAVAVVELFGKALAAGDLKTVATLLDTEVLILESGGSERSRDEYMGHHAIGDAAFLRGVHIQLKQRRARLHGARPTPQPPPLAA